MDADLSPPATFGIALDPGVRRLSGGRVLLGGDPLRLLRLSDAGASLLEQWERGAPVGRGGALARRLLDAGVAHPLPRGPAPGPDQVAIVIPVHDDAAALERCLRAVGETVFEILVVDDGSFDAAAVRVAAARGAPAARVLRRERSGGPAAARNAGLGATSAPLMAFLDSDCEPQPGWLATLLAHLADKRVGVVAPRVACTPGTSALYRYDAVRSPLDLGERAGPIAPGTRISYVPAAALLVRRAALGEGDAFDERLRVGEDVDLLWRLHAAGWSLRYEPTARVLHPPRPSLRRWLSQRAAYGSSAAPLAASHPGRLAPMAQPLWSIAPALLTVGGRPGAAIAAFGGLSALTARRLGAVAPAERAPAALALAGRGALHGGRALADATWRAWWPVLVPLAARSPRARRALALSAALPAFGEWCTRRPALDPVRFLALRTLDDAAYATGVWRGCVGTRTLAPLLPRVPARLSTDR